jgi:integrase/recombinase XerC
MGDDLTAALEAWRRWLSVERNLSPNTLAAYRRDLSDFLDFLALHLGEPPDLAALGQLAPKDVRSYLAHRVGRGLAATSNARALAAVRSFSRFILRRGLGQVPAVDLIRTPKVPRALPKPLAVADALGTVDTVADLSDEPWVGRRDVALVSLL